MKKYYEDLIKTKNFKHVAICTLWLSDEDYPVIIGENCASVSHLVTIIFSFYVFYCYVAIAIVRFCRLGSVSSQVIIGFGSAHEGGGHVWLRTTGLCNQVQLVSLWRPGTR